MYPQASWQQPYYLFGLGLGFSTLLAALPVVTLLFLLAVLRKAAWKAGLSGLGVAFAVAVLAYRMPVVPAISAGLMGAAFGLLPISWIVFWAIALYRITVETGMFDIIKDSMGRLTADPRLQAMLIAFAFGAFVEGAAGFGTPVAVAAAMLTGLGFSPLSASAMCLLANTAPVAFGSIAVPIVTLSATTGLPLDKLSAAVGWVCAPIALILPAYITSAMGGWSALANVWPAAAVAGISFAAVQLLIANTVGPALADILASLTCIGALVVLFRFWRPVRGVAAHHGHFVVAAVGAPGRTISTGTSAVAVASEPMPYSAGKLLYAWMPYIILVLCVLLWGFKPITAFLNSFSIPVQWPFLHNVAVRTPPVVSKAGPYAAVFNFNWLSAAGTSCMLATILSAAFLKMSPARFGKLLISVTRQLFLPTVTVTSVLAMAFLMNYCGATGTFGLAFSATGAMFPFFSSFLGWLGVFLTGSDTSANALFGSLQTVTAGKLGLSPVLMAAGNAGGGGTGKMISLQTIAVAAAATGMSVEDQAKLFRFTLRHSLILATVAGLLVVLYSYVWHIGV